MKASQQTKALAAAVRAARAAGKLMRQNLRAAKIVNLSTAYDIKLELDVRSQNLIEKILRAAEKEVDIVLWDGGNNDFPFFKPDLFVVVADPLRAGHELHYHPGETNIRMADVVVINKVDSASPEQVAEVKADIAEMNRQALLEVRTTLSQSKFWN